MTKAKAPASTGAFRVCRRSESGRRRRKDTRPSAPRGANRM